MVLPFLFHEITITVLKVVLTCRIRKTTLQEERNSLTHIKFHIKKLRFEDTNAD